MMRTSTGCRLRNMSLKPHPIIPSWWGFTRASKRPADYFSSSSSSEVATWCSTCRGKDVCRRNMPGSMLRRSLWRSTSSTARVSYTVIWSWTMCCWTMRDTSSWPTMECVKRASDLGIRLPHSVVHRTILHRKYLGERIMDFQWIGGL